MKVVNRRTGEIIASGLSHVEARKVWRECYEKAGLPQIYTGLPIACDHAVKILRRYELDWLLDHYPMFFSTHAKWSKTQEAFVVDDHIWERLEQAFDHFVIECESSSPVD